MKALVESKHTAGFDSAQEGGGPSAPDVKPSRTLGGGHPFGEEGPPVLDAVHSLARSSSRLNSNCATFVPTRGKSETCVRCIVKRNPCIAF